MFKGYILPSLLMLALLMPPSVTIADNLNLKEGHPDQHSVVNGDTLWDISAKFLQDPWRWPEIWEVNPALENPHLIYPGDIIFLSYVDGKPVLKVNRSETRIAGGPNTVILSPYPRISTLDHAIPMIPYDAIRQFLDHPFIMTPEEVEHAAYITASEEGRLISGNDHKIYVRGLPNTYSEFDVIRPGTPYYNNPKRKKEILGYEAIKLATAKVEAFGDPATLRIKHSAKEVLVGDRLVPSRQQDISQNFNPKAPSKQVSGQIISVPAGITRVSQFQIAVVNIGTVDGLKTGNILAVFQQGREVRDPITGQKVQLPDERAGIMMVVRTLNRFSYALIMEASRDIRLYDMVRNP
ncbi:MAG: LysM peptidoglycan-binding domain-containing protein [Thiotrichaceae bacterium]|nr:LysM peptidoglycan-binding domain-containing protein [Thiotrichaceae bacterium]